MDKASYLLGILLIVATTGVIGKHHGHDKSGGKIVGGYNTTIQIVPYQAHVLVKIGNDYYQCGGSILSPTRVLTAAHCLVGVTRIYVRIGSTDAQSGGTRYTTSLYTIHPLYNSKTSDYDVGIIRLRRAMNLDGTNAKAITLAEEGQEVPAGTDLLITGWGDTMANGDSSRYLMAVTIPTVSTEDCKKSYGQNAITSRMICAGLPEGGKDSCQGDSGGPAVNSASGVQLGIVSFGTGCARPGVPGVYTNVSSVRAWIRTNSGV